MQPELCPNGSTSAADDGASKPAASQIVGQNGQRSNPAESVSPIDAASKPETGKPAEPANDDGLEEIERIASAVDLAIALEDN